jgi:deoxyribose-phosphate aldolase
MAPEEQADLCLWSPAPDLSASVQRAQAGSFHGISVFTSRLFQLGHLLGETGAIKVLAAVGFPFGAADSDAKRYEVEVAIDLGAQEIDFFLNTGDLKNGAFSEALRELRDAVEAADERPLTAIIQPNSLTPELIEEACKLVLDADAQAIGIWLPNAPVTEVRQARNLVGPKFGVKAYIPSSALVMRSKLREAGATRFGVD